MLFVFNRRLTCIVQTSSPCPAGTTKQPPLYFARWFCHGGIHRPNQRPRLHEISGLVWRREKPQPLGVLLYGVRKTYGAGLSNALADKLGD
jgi:hypothetical protein